MSLSTSSEPIWQIADASNPFKNCSDYEGSKDDKYIPCLSNTTGDPCDLIYVSFDRLLKVSTVSGTA